MSEARANLPVEELANQASGGPSLLTVAWRRKGLVAIGLVLGVVLGSLYYSQQLPKYQSSADLVVWKRRSDPIQMSGQDSRLAVLDDYVATQTTLMRSRDVLLKAGGHLNKNRTEMRNLPPGSDEDLIGYIASGLNITRPRDPGSNSNVASNIINVAWRGGTSEDCPKVIEAVIAGYKDSLRGDVNAAQLEDVRQTRVALEKTEKEITSAQEELKKTQGKIQNQSAVSLTEIRTRIGLFETRLIEMNDKRIEIDSRLKQIQRGIAEKKDPKLLMALFQLTSNKSDVVPQRPVNELRQPDDALFNLRLQEEELLHSYGPDHPQVLAIRKRMKSIKEYLEKNTQLQPGSVTETGASPTELIQLYVQILEEEKKKFAELQKNLRDNLEEDTKTVRSMDVMVNEEKNLQARLETLLKRSLGLTERLNAIQLTQDAPLYEARVINPPGNGGKVAPVMASTISFGAILGLLAGLGLAFLAELSDKSFRSPEEIRRRLGVSVIGHIPPLIAHEATDPAVKRLDPMLVVHHRPKSIEAESYRGLRTSLYFSTVGKGHQVIQVTSPNPGDGKSTLIANLAASIAQSGKKVILIDCDFRKPRVHKIFGLDSAEIGLASVLLGEAECGLAIHQCAVPGLDLLLCGPRPTNPAELLSSQAYRDFLDEIRKRYDFVLIDTPPLLAVSDPAVVAHQVDGVILCTRLTKTARPAAERAKDILANMNANLMGVVVNDSQAAAKGYDNYAGYGYSYGYNYQYQYSEDYTDDPNVGGAAASGRKKR
jgi:capsular exopolysaccharide synthesis family protein